MTEVEHLRIMVGDLVLRVAQQAAEIDALREHIAAPPPAPTPAPAAPSGSV